MNIPTADAPVVPELWDTARIAEHLGITSSRVRQIAQRADFPDPLPYRLNAGYVWIAAQVLEFEKGWDRSCRPSRSVAKKDKAATA